MNPQMRADLFSETTPAQRQAAYDALEEQKLRKLKNKIPHLENKVKKAEEFVEYCKTTEYPQEHAKLPRAEKALVEAKRVLDFTLTKLEDLTGQSEAEAGGGGKSRKNKKNLRKRRTQKVQKRKTQKGKKHRR